MMNNGDREVIWHYKEKERLYKRITALESQVTELVTILDTLTDKLIESGVLVKRKGVVDEG